MHHRPRDEEDEDESPLLLHWDRGPCFLFCSVHGADLTLMSSCLSFFRPFSERRPQKLISFVC